MLVTLINWCYMTLIFFATGITPLKLTKRLFKIKSDLPPVCVIINGMVTVTLYAQIFSLFHSVDMTANLIILAVSVICLIVEKKETLFLFSKLKNRAKNKKKYIFLAEILILALITAGPVTLGDAFLYHIQTIRWIHEYGAVPGIANLISRLGFNSSVHSLSALFDMSLPIKNIHLHTVTGYFVMLVCVYATGELIENVVSDRQNPIKLKNAIDLAMLVYVLIQTAWISSPVTDVPESCVIFIVMSIWAGAIEENEFEDTGLLILLCLWIVYAVTIKLSAALYVLFAVCPAVLLIKKREYGKTILAILTGIFIAAPFLIRNIIISGWLIYPFKAIDLFDVDWKVPVFKVIAEAACVTDYARNPMSIDPQGKSWLYTWIMGSSQLKWILYLVLFIMFTGEVIFVIRHLIKNDVNLLKIHFVAVVIMNILYWFLMAPDTRFGWPAILTGIVILPALCLEKKPFNYVLCMLAGGILLLYSGFYAYRTVKLVTGNLRDTIIVQTDYDTSLMRYPEHQKPEVEIVNGYKIYSADNPGDTYFPAIDRNTGFTMRGSGIRDGFCCSDF